MAETNASPGGPVSATLYYREGASDKIYQASLEAKAGGFVVNFAFGRRGQTLSTGTKTQTPAPYAKAKAIYDKLIAEKSAKGYTPGEDGTPYHLTDDQQRATGILPQLLNAIDEAAAEKLVLDDAWWMQEKHDGRRVLLKKDGATITGVNRRGLSIGLPEKLVRAATEQPAKSFLLDGECIGDTLYAFDLLEWEGQDLRGSPYRDRYLRMSAGDVTADAGVLAFSAALQCVPTATTEAQKRQALGKWKAQGREGAVFKRHDAAYKVGRPASGGSQFKLKFCQSCSAVVAKVNNKRSVALALYQDGTLVDAGNVTVPVNFQVPGEGAVVEVRYLYAYQESGKLYQPTYLGPRDDVEAQACVRSQLKFKAADAAADEDEA